MNDIRIVKGKPDDEELAAVVAALSLVERRSQAQKAAPGNEISRWRLALQGPAWRANYGRGAGTLE